MAKHMDISRLIYHQTKERHPSTMTFNDFNIIHMEMLKGVQKVSILYKNRCRYIVMRVFTYSDWATLESLLHNIEGVKFKWLMLKIAIHGVWGPHTEPSFSGKAVVSHQFTHESCMHYIIKMSFHILECYLKKPSFNSKSTSMSHSKYIRRCRTENRNRHCVIHFTHGD